MEKNVPNVSWRLLAKISNAASAPVVLRVNCRARATSAISSDVPDRSKAGNLDERKSAPSRIAMDVFHIESYIGKTLMSF